MAFILAALQGLGLQPLFNVPDSLSGTNTCIQILACSSFSPVPLSQEENSEPTILPQVLALQQLGKLTYLTVVIRESLRLGLGVPGRLPRMVPPEGISLSGVHIIGGTVVSSNALMLHMNPMLLCEP